MGLLSMFSIYSFITDMLSFRLLTRDTIVILGSLTDNSPSVIFSWSGTIDCLLNMNHFFLVY